MSEDTESFKHAPRIWDVQEKERIDGVCLFCEAPYVGQMIEAVTPTTKVQMCPGCWAEFVESEPEVKEVWEAKLNGRECPVSRGSE